MKKALFLLMISCLFSLGMKAQDVTLLNNIKATNGKIKTFEADLANTLVKPKNTTTQKASSISYRPRSSPHSSPQGST